MVPRIFEIEWPDFNVTVCAELLEEENSEMCEAFWQGLPCTTMFMASMSAGHILKVPISFSLPMPGPEKRALIMEEPPGTIMVFSNNEIIMTYGTVVEPFMMPRLARIPENELTKLNSAAVKLSDAYFFTKEINMATLRRKE